MPHDYLNALIFILLGFVGAYGHYLKKRYWDNTTTVSLYQYLVLAKQATKHAVGAIITAEIGLAASGLNVWPISLRDLVGVLAVGYMADSTVNKVPAEPPSTTKTVGDTRL